MESKREGASKRGPKKVRKRSVWRHRTPQHAIAQTMQSVSAKKSLKETGRVCWMPVEAQHKERVSRVRLGTDEAEPN